MRIEVHNTIEAVSPHAWDEVAGADAVIRTHGFLLAVERSQINDCRYWYVTAWDGDRLVAHCSFFSISFFLDIFAEGAVARAFGAVRRVFPGFLRLRLMECGSPVALGHMFSIRPECAAADVLPQFIAAIEATARAEGIAMLVTRDFTPEQMGEFEAFKTRGYGVVDNLPDCVLENRWATFDDYLASMRSEYRYKIRKRIGVAQKAGIRAEVRGDFADLAPRLRALWHNTFQRSREYQREILTETYFEQMDRCLGDQSCVVLLKKGDEIVAFALVLLDARTLRFIYTGLDYEHNREDCLFFMLLYEVVRLGIERGRPLMELGFTTYPPKMDVGAQLQPLRMWMKHSRRSLSPAVVALFRATTPAQKVTARKVFRPVEPPA